MFCEIIFKSDYGEARILFACKLQKLKDVTVSAKNRSNKVTLPIIRTATAACLFPDQIYDQRTECGRVMLKIQHSQSVSSVSVE